MGHTFILGPRYFQPSIGLILGLSRLESASTLNCDPWCGKTMIGPVSVKALDVHIPDLSIVNGKYWTFKRQEHELEGLGYVCPTCGNTRIIKSFAVEGTA